jgi:hypothetical protein
MEGERKREKEGERKRDKEGGTKRERRKEGKAFVFHKTMMQYILPDIRLGLKF